MFKLALVPVPVLALLAFLVAACDDGGVGSPTAAPTEPGASTAVEATPDVGPVTIVLPSALNPDFGTPGTQGTPTPGPERAPEVAAAEDLGRRLEQPTDAFEVISVIAMDFPDTCLGLAEPREICAQAITPGFEVMLQLAETIYTYHTTTDGTVARFADVQIGPDPES